MSKWVISIGLHAIWFAGFMFLLNSSGTRWPDWDAMTFSLSMLQTALVIFGLIGFGYVAVMAERTARVTANNAFKDREPELKEEARKIAENLVKSELPAMVKREIQEQKDLAMVLGSQPPSEKSTQEAANSLDGDPK